jgi:hypothetical protein
LCPKDDLGVSRLDINKIECATCILGVPEADFSNNMEKIIVKFGVNMNLVDPSVD